MTPFASVAMLEKLALLKIAFCKAPVLSNASWRRTLVMPSAVPAAGLRMARSRIFLGMADLRVKRKMVWRRITRPRSQEERWKTIQVDTGLGVIANCPSGKGTMFAGPAGRRRLRPYSLTNSYRQHGASPVVVLIIPLVLTAVCALEHIRPLCGVYWLTSVKSAKNGRSIKRDGLIGHLGR